MYQIHNIILILASIDYFLCVRQYTKQFSWIYYFNSPGKLEVCAVIVTLIY